MKAMCVKKSSLVVVVVALAVGVVFAGRAHATTYGTLDANFLGVHPRESVTLHAFPGSDEVTDPGTERSLRTRAGVYRFQKTGGDDCVTGLDLYDTFGTHCIDISDYVRSSNSWDVCDVQDAPDPTTYLGGFTISPAQEVALQMLFSRNADVSTDQKAAARQIAVWEVVFEHWNPYKVTAGDGSFYVTDTASDTAGLADTMLNDLGPWQVGEIMPQLYAFVDRDPYSYPDEQDQLWLVPGGGQEYIPEPVTMLGLVLGFASVGAYIRRRRML